MTDRDWTATFFLLAIIGTLFGAVQTWRLAQYEAVLETYERGKRSVVIPMQEIVP